MPQFIYDVIVWINIIAFVITLIDKIACGRLAGLFWLAAIGFGGCGCTIGCLVFRHRTANGDLSVAVFFTIVQFGILWLLEKIF